MKQLFIGLTIGAIIGLSVGAGIVHTQDTAHGMTPVVSHPTVYSLWQDINAVRTANGLSALTLDPLLDNSATAKCNDMSSKNYWSHNTPTGATPWTFMDAAGVKYSTAGENLYLGKNWDSNGVVNAWMNSPEHKANIMNPSFQQVGYAICTAPHYQNTTYPDLVVQHFTN